MTAITVLDQEKSVNIVHQCFHLEMPLPSLGTSLSKVDRGEVGKCPVVWVVDIYQNVYLCLLSGSLSHFTKHLLRSHWVILVDLPQMIFTRIGVPYVAKEATFSTYYNNINL